MRVVSTLVLVSIALFAGKTAFAQQQLKDVVVTAHTLDGRSAMIPFSLMQDMRVTKNRDVAILEDYVTPLTLAQVCSNLKKAQPGGCSTTTFPAASGLPGALGLPFSGNGCGADPDTSFIGDLILKASINGFSGDLNRPVQGDGAIDFTGACNNHDKCYTSMHTQLSCDTQLGQTLLSICGRAGPVFGPTCVTLANAYTEAVNDFGSAAYIADQKDLKCSAWGNSMKANGC